MIAQKLLKSRKCIILTRDKSRIRCTYTVGQTQLSYEFKRATQKIRKENTYDSIVLIKKLDPKMKVISANLNNNSIDVTVSCNKSNQINRNVLPIQPEYIEIQYPGQYYSILESMVTYYQHPSLIIWMEKTGHSELPKRYGRNTQKSGLLGELNTAILNTTSSDTYPQTGKINS